MNNCSWSFYSKAAWFCDTIVPIARIENWLGLIVLILRFRFNRKLISELSLSLVDLQNVQHFRKDFACFNIAFVELKNFSAPDIIKSVSFSECHY